MRIVNTALACALATTVLCGAPSVMAQGSSRGGANAFPPTGTRIVYGDQQRLGSGASVFTWARVNAVGQVLEVGVNIPRQLIWNPPMHGTGPARSFEVLNFPDVVKNSTFFNHFEVHWNEHGHEPPVFEVPHFDFHFYGIPESAVWNIAGPDTAPPSPDMIPAGYFYPGVEASVPQMGVHAVNPADLSGPFSTSMILGYWHGRMTFIEPMITRDFLLTHPNFAMPIPRPNYLAVSTQYPAVFQSKLNRHTGSYELTFRGFSTVTGPPAE